jgi:hypothetical protein
VTTPAAATAPVKPASIWEDFVDIFYAPSSVYERRRNAGWGLPLLVYTLLSAVMLFAARPMMQPMLERQASMQIEKMREQGMSGPQLESASKMTRGMIDSPLALIPIVLFVPLGVFLSALVLWMASKTFGSAQSLGQSMTVATFANFPRVLVGIVSLLILYATGSEGMSSQYAAGLSPASLLPDDTSVLVLALLSRLELGVIWATILLGVGTHVIGRVSKQSAAMIALAVWLLASLFVVGGAAMQAS